MNQAEYAALTEACDEILTSPTLNLERTAISWLHVLSEHPNNLTKYSGVFDAPSIGASFKRHFWHALGIAEAVLRALWQPERSPICKSHVYEEQVDVLFISHLVSVDTAVACPDFYYGDLPEELGTRNIRSLTALISHVPKEGRSIESRLNRGGVAARVVLPRWTTFRKELLLWSRVMAAAEVLRGEATNTQSNFRRRVASEAARNAPTRATIFALRLHDQIRELCERFNPRSIVVTWEGHAWERLAFHAARSVNPNVHCIGYQHTILLPRTHALKRSLGKDYDPNVIFTVGEVNRAALMSAIRPQGIPIYVYGTHRRPNVSASPRQSDASARCLVVPEGLESECLILLKFAFSVAERIPRLDFIVRMHPIMPYTRLASRNSWLRKLPKNVKLSEENDIQADFARCDWAIYRGTSAAVLAVLAGVRPLYLECPGELSIDPLFAMPGWRLNVRNVSEFEAAVEADRLTPRTKKNREWQAAESYCREYFSIPDMDRVRDQIMT